MIIFMKITYIILITSFLFSMSACASGKDIMQLGIHHPLLGDGTHTDHFFFFADYLEDNPGTLKKAREIEKSQNEIDQHNKNSGPNAMMKPPSASISESEFSHVLRSIALDERVLLSAKSHRFQ